MMVPAVGDMGSRLVMFKRLVTSEIGEYSKTNIVVVVKWVHKLFCEHKDFDDIQKRCSLMYPSYSNVKDDFKEYHQVIQAIEERVNEFDYTHLEQELKQKLDESIYEIQSNIIRAREAVLCIYHQNADVIGLYKGRMDDYFLNEQEVEHKNHQKLIVYVLEECRRQNLRKHNGKTALFCPYYENDIYTYHYKYKMEIGEFIHDCLYPHSTNSQMFLWLTDRPGTFRATVDYLTNCVDDKLPSLQRTRTMFSFKNGIYDAREDAFYPFAGDEDWEYNITSVDNHTVSAHFIDRVFQYRQYEDDMKANDDPMDIKTPNCQTILDSQEFERDVCMWSYGAIGRMIFPNGTLDNWQFFVFFQGIAGSGKSTILKIAANFYSEQDVGILMNEGQQNFSIEHLYDKYMFICYDIDKKLTLSQTRWNQMVSGEHMSVERKFKTAVQLQWQAAGAFAGNTYPPWPDNQGSVSRRFLIFKFDKVVKNTDPELEKKCTGDEFPAFLKKCVSCYHHLLKLHGKRGIWDRGVLPTYFHKTKSELQNQSSPLRKFIQNESYCHIGENEFCTYQEFRASYIKFLDEIRYRDQSEKDLSSNDSSVMLVFNNFGIETIVPPVNADPSIYKTDVRYLQGLSLVQ